MQSVESLVGLIVLICVVVIGVLAYRNKIQRLKLEALATTDELTGLLNRRQMLEQLSSQLNFATRYDYPLCAALVDLDWFKRVNDKFGYFTGDKVLRLFSSSCQRVLRETDMMGRVGGDAFLLLLPHTEPHDALQLMEDLRLQMEKLSTEINMPDLRLTASIGVCHCHDDDLSERVLTLVETALYRAKKNGRDQVVLCDRHEDLNQQ